MDETTIETIEDGLASDVCMNPAIPDCGLCVFNGWNDRTGNPWCHLSERLAKSTLLQLQAQEVSA